MGQEWQVASVLLEDTTVSDQMMISHHIPWPFPLAQHQEPPWHGIIYGLHFYGLFQGTLQTHLVTPSQWLIFRCACLDIAQTSHRAKRGVTTEKKAAVWVAGQIEVFRLHHRQSSSITGEIDTGMVSILGQPYGYCRHHQTKLLTNWSMSNEKTVVYDCPLFGILATCSMNLVGCIFLMVMIPYFPQHGVLFIVWMCRP